MPAAAANAIDRAYSAGLEGRRYSLRPSQPSLLSHEPTRSLAEPASTDRYGAIPAPCPHSERVGSDRFRAVDWSADIDRVNFNLITFRRARNRCRHRRILGRLFLCTFGAAVVRLERLGCLLPSRRKSPHFAVSRLPSGTIRIEEPTRTSADKP